MKIFDYYIQIDGLVIVPFSYVSSVLYQNEHDSNLANLNETGVNSIHILLKYYQIYQIKSQSNNQKQCFVNKLVYNRYIVFPISQLIKTMTDNGNKLYFYFQTQKELDSVHSKGVIHADIKPANIIANSKTKLFTLIGYQFE